MLVREKDKEKKRHSFSLKSELERALTNAVAKQDLTRNHNYCFNIVFHYTQPLVASELLLPGS